MSVNMSTVLTDDTSCERCPASWYCPGDGTRLSCARCEGATCGQNATEHSFGAALECTTCPEGWVSPFSLRVTGGVC